MHARFTLQGLVVAVAPLLVAAAASLGDAGTAWAQPPQPSADEVKAATARFEKGTEFFNDKKFALALAEFQASYKAVPSPNSHLMIARCLAGLGEPVDAYDEFDKTYAEATARAATEAKYKPTADSAKTERDELAAKLAIVTVSVKGDEPSTRLMVGGVDVPRDRWGKALARKPGAVDVVLDTPNRPPHKESLTLAAGQKKELALDAAPPPPPRAAPPPAPASRSHENLRPYAYVAGGIGAAGLVMFTVAGVMANSTYSDLRDSCKGEPCPPDRAGDISSGKTQQTLANVGLVVGVVGVAAGATLFVVSGGLKRHHRVEPAKAVWLGPGSAGVRGEF